jgi:glycine hydroxymethyltransferase
VTTQGMAEPEMAEIAELIHSAAREPESPAVTQRVRSLAERFPTLSTKPQCGDSASP